MIRINNIKLKIGYTADDIEAVIKKNLKLSYVPAYKIAKLSIDSRKKDQIHYVAAVDVICDNEEKILRKVHNNNIMLTKETIYLIPEPGTTPMQYRPVIIGSGPAGLFAGLFLAREGYRPIILERGMAGGRTNSLCKWILEKGTSVKSKLQCSVWGRRSRNIF